MAKPFFELTEVLDPEPHGAAWNMAMDEALLRSAREPLVRFYRWARPSVSFGYFGRIDEVEQASSGCELVRRWTGGGIVHHGSDITYTIVLPPGSKMYASASSDVYGQIHEAVADAIRGACGEVHLAAKAGPIHFDACFENPVEGDVMAGPTKMAGAAQRRTRFGLLHQGSIQIGGFDPAVVEDFRTALADRIAKRVFSAEEVSIADRLASERYGAVRWLRRF